MPTHLSFIYNSNQPACVISNLPVQFHKRDYSTKAAISCDIVIAIGTNIDAFNLGELLFNQQSNWTNREIHLNGKVNKWAKLILNILMKMWNVKLAKTFEQKAMVKLHKDTTLLVMLLPRLAENFSFA